MKHIIYRYILKDNLKRTLIQKRKQLITFIFNNFKDRLVINKILKDNFKLKMIEKDSQLVKKAF